MDLENTATDHPKTMRIRGNETDLDTMEKTNDRGPKRCMPQAAVPLCH